MYVMVDFKPFFRNRNVLSAFLKAKHIIKRLPLLSLLWYHITSIVALYLHNVRNFVNKCKGIVGG